MQTNNISDYIETIPDFPEKGVLFRDISTLLASKFPETIDAMLNLLSPAELDAADAFAGIDARGFIFASAMAIKTNKNMIMLRKKGKLPPPTVHKNYGLEYGTASIETRYQKPLNIIIVDDVLATGGTLEAAADLCLEAGHNVRALVTLINLAHLNNFSWKHLKAHSLISYDE